MDELRSSVRFPLKLPVQVRAEQSGVTGELFYDDDETQSVRYDTDFAITKPRGECFVVGSCHVPGGRESPVSGVAFKIGAVSKNVSPPVDFTSYTLSCSSRTLASKVPPPRS